MVPRPQVVPIRKPLLLLLLPLLLLLLLLPLLLLLSFTIGDPEDLCNSLPRRLAELDDNEGRHLKY